MKYLEFSRGNSAGSMPGLVGLLSGDALARNGATWNEMRRIVAVARRNVSSPGPGALARYIALIPL